MNTTQATVAMIDALEAVGIPYMLVTRKLLDEIRKSIPPIDG